MKYKLLTLSMILVICLSACGFSINFTETTPGPMMTEVIELPAPAENGTHRLNLSLGAGELFIEPGASGLVTGEVNYNLADFKPVITSTSKSTEIKQGNYKFNQISGIHDLKNIWDLKLGSQPIALEISAGAYKAEYEFGDLALTNLLIKDGAADVNLSFTQPNLAEMNLLKYETGASQVRMRGLANANFTMMEFNGGAGNYLLDFSGELQRNASVSVSTGLGNLSLIIPEGVSVQLTVDGAFANISIPHSWTRNGNTYFQDGEGPMLTIVVEIGAANLVVSNE